MVRTRGTTGQQACSKPCNRVAAVGNKEAPDTSIPQPEGVSIAFLLGFCSEVANLPPAEPEKAEKAGAEGACPNSSPPTNPSAPTISRKRGSTTSQEQQNASATTAAGKASDSSASSSSSMLPSTRRVAQEVKKRTERAEPAEGAEGTEGTEQSSQPYTSLLAGERYFLTDGLLCGPSQTWVAHAWDMEFKLLTTALENDAKGDFDRRYTLDLFGVDLHAACADPVAAVKAGISRCSEVLLVLDAEACVLGRLWVLFEVLLAMDACKLRSCCAAPGGFGSSEGAVRAWETRIDQIDWVQARATRRSDERRLRQYADKVWEPAKGVESLLCKLKKLLRVEVHSQILLAATLAGDEGAVRAAIAAGADVQRPDSYGNTAEMLASYHGHPQLEELLFAERVKHQQHMDFRSFLDPAQCPINIPDGVDLTFLTEPGNLMEGQDPAELIRSTLLSGGSTRTPGSSSSAGFDKFDNFEDAEILEQLGNM